MNSEVNRQAITTHCGPPASGTRISGAGKRKQPNANVRPMPNRLPMRAVTNEPASVPTDAAPSTSPSVAGPTCSERVA